MRYGPLALVCFAAATVSLAACDQAINPIIASLGGGTTSGDTTTVTLVLTPAAPQLTVAQTVQLSTNAATSLLPIQWTTSDATVATVSSTGLVTAIGAGTATITAKSSVDANATGTALVTVTM